MLYNTCPTCGFFIGNLITNFENNKNKICNNPDLSDDEIEKRITKLIMTLPVRRYCCRMRFMTYKDYVNDLVAPDESI